MSHGRRWWWLAVLGLCCAACMDAPGTEGSEAAAVRDLGDAGAGFDAGPTRPPTGHVPDASYCVQLADIASAQGTAGAEASGRAGAGADRGASGTDAMHTAADGGSVDGVVLLTDAGAVIAAPSTAGQVVITEWLADPKNLSDTDGEWLELYNPGDEPLDLATCGIGDDAASVHVFGEHVLLAPQQYVTLARTAEPGFKPAIVTTLSLTNSADQLVLWCGGVEIDRVQYDRAVGFPVQPGASTALDPSLLDAESNDAADAWCAALDSYGPELGTPGAANPPCDLSDAATP